MTPMLAELCDDLANDMEMVAARSAFVEAIYSADWRVRHRGLRGFYKAAAPTIARRPAHQWAIDAYEVDWLRVFTPIEQALWYDIRLCGAVLYPQFPVGRYFVDFGHPVAKVAIECDGKIHNEQLEADAERQAEIERAGWKVYRITGRGCFDAGRTWFDDEGTERAEPSAAERLIREAIARHGIGGRGALPQPEGAEA